MKKLLNKEFRLTSLKLTYFFILFALMTFIPGYPILISAFFLTLGIFQSFENARLQNDILFTILLPVTKKDIVVSKYCYVMILEGLFFLLCIIFTAIRMTLLKEAPIYKANAMMNANLAYLGYILIILALFNSIFVGGFFKTAYFVGKPFLIYGAISFAVVFVAEVLHHIPGLSNLNSQSDGLAMQASILVSAIVIYALLSLLSMKSSIERFEKLDI